MKKLIFLTSLCFSFPALGAQDLLEIFELALLNDPQYSRAEAERDSTLETRPQAIARLLPLLSGTGGTEWNYLHNKKITFQRASADQSPTSEPSRATPATQTFWVHSIGASLTQPIFDWELWVQLSQSENLIAESEARYSSALQDLMVRTINAYLNVLLAQDTLEFSLASKRALARQLEQAHQRFEVGLIAITDVLEAQSGYDQANANAIVAANDVDNSKEALREIVGDNDANLEYLGEVLPLKKPEPENINEWSQVALVQNLDILAAQNQMEFARKNIELQRTGHYPTIDLTGSYAYQDANSTFGLRGENGAIGIEVNIPIYSGGAVNSRMRQARYDFDAEKDNLSEIRRRVTRQVKNAYRSVISSISEVLAFEAAVKSSMSSLEAVEAGFEVGTRTMVDVVDDERDLFLAKRDYAQSRYNYINNWVFLKQAASTLVQEDLDRINRLLGSGNNNP